MVSYQKFCFGNYFARGEFVLYINHSGKYIEINFNMKIPFLPSGCVCSLVTCLRFLTWPLLGPFSVFLFFGVVFYCHSSFPVVFLGLC